jgi:hypothetical protein
MSTSVTRSGTTTGRSGRGLGFAAAALAVVIAGGFVFALNQGNDATTSNASTQAAEIAAQRNAEKVEQLEAAHEAALADELRVKTQPDFGIENIRYQLAHDGLLEGGTYVPFATGSPYTAIPGAATQAIPERMDGNLDVVKSQLTQAGLLDEGTYVPSIVQPVDATEGAASSPKELNQPEWDNRLP